jgi:hypothetical protein
MNLLFTLAQVKETMRTWRHDYNRGRPHSLFGGVPPSYRSGQITHGVQNTDLSI